MSRLARLRLGLTRLAVLCGAALLGARALAYLKRRRPARPTEHVARNPRQAPEEVIREWLDEHGPVTVGPKAIAQTWGLERLEDRDRRDITAALARAGVEVEPPLEQTRGGDSLALSVVNPPVASPVQPAESEEPAEPILAPEVEPRAQRLTTPRRAAALVLSVLRWTLLGAAIGLVGALVGAKAFGYETMTVMSGSMEPRIHTGDVVVAKPISPLDARVGDVISFQEPHGHGRLITHRVRSMRVQTGKVRFVTKGDANNTTERWQIPQGGKIARVTNRGWKVGYALAFVRDPEKRLLLISIPAVLLGLFELVRIWRPRLAGQNAREKNDAIGA